MKLADKLIVQRKKKGLSQEEVADMLDVSRQSVSKWESAQCAPELNKLIQLSKIYGVTLDYLLKNDVEEETEQDNEPDKKVKTGTKILSKNDIKDYLDQFKKIAVMFAVAIAFCFIGPTIGGSVLYAYARNDRINHLDITNSIVIAVVIAVAFLTAAIAICIIALQRGKKSGAILKGAFEFENDAELYLISRRVKAIKMFSAFKIAGVCLIACAAALLAGGIICVDRLSDEYLLIDFIIAAVLVIMCAVVLFTLQYNLKNAYERLALKGEFDEDAFARKKAIAVSVMYWILAAVIFAVALVETGSWLISGAILAFAILVYFSVIILMIGFRTKGQNK